jgi:hypothetical protein
LAPLGDAPRLGAKADTARQLATIVEVTKEYLANEHRGKLRTNRPELVESLHFSLHWHASMRHPQQSRCAPLQEWRPISATRSIRSNSRLICDFSLGGTAPPCVARNCSSLGIA